MQMMQNYIDVLQQSTIALILQSDLDALIMEIEF